MTELVAFLDESRKPARSRATGRPSGRGDHYVVAAAIVLQDDQETVRQSLSSIEATLGYPLHYADLRSSERRVAAITALDEIGDWDGYLFETAQPLPQRHHSEHHVRAKILTAAFTALATDVHVSNIILETRNTPTRGLTQLDSKDHQVLQKLLTHQTVPASLRIAHADKTEPILAIPDILAGARSDALCATDEEPYARIAHRVRRTVSIAW